MTIIDGAMATAASVEGAKDPTAIPMEDAAMLSNVNILRKFKIFPSPE